jgi:hypothetical protein
MNDMTGNNFERTLETWLRSQAPQQAPDWVLDAALERVEVEPQKQGWLQRHFEGNSMTVMLRTAAAAAVIAIAGFVGLQLVNPPPDVGPSPSPSPAATPSVAPTSLPMPSTAPSPEPSAGALVAHLVGGGELGPFHLVTIFDDGRVITSDPSGETAPKERRLTAAGIQLVRDEMAATGLTDAPANFQPVPNPGVEPPGGGIGDVGNLEIGQAGGSTIVITWNLYADTEPGDYQPQPEAEALQALGVRLSTLEEWLPAAAWADPIAAPYEPDDYRMTIDGSAWGGSADDLPADVATVDWPPTFDTAALTEVIDSADDEVRCGLIDAAVGTAVISALQAAGARPENGTNLAFGLGVPETSRLVTITLAPILPFDDGTC